MLGIIFNNRGLVGWLPVIANLEYSVAIFRFRDKENWLKAASIISTVMFIVFSLAIMNYVAAVGNTVVAATTAVSLAKEARSNKF